MSYPGGIMIAGAKVTSTVTGDNSYDMTYAINATIDTSTWASSTSKLKWTLYEVDALVSDPLVTGCELDQTKLAQNQYSYGETCKAATAITEGTEIASSTEDITAGSSETIKITNDQLKIEDTSSTKSVTKNYYLVVEYPESEGDQNTDMGKTASVSITGIADTKAVIHAGA